MTIAKEQRRTDCYGLCYIYAPIGAIEGLANIYMNNLNDQSHINYDLSEQNVLDCDGYSGSANCETDCECGYIYITNNYIRNNGVFDNVCYQNGTGGAESCNPSGCQNPDYKLTFNSSHYVTPTLLNIKTKLIEKGPLTCLIENYMYGGNHALALVGYGKIKLGDTYPDPRNGNTIEVTKYSPYIGRTYWKFKNSYGTDEGDNGYTYLIAILYDPYQVTYYDTPVDNLLTPETEEPLCFDKDHDGYWNWGIQYDPPQECSSINPLDKDSDDSNPRLSPFDENYYSVPVAPLMEVKNESGEVIPNNSFYSFYDNIGLNDQITLTFTIQNNGDAKLNLRPNNLNTTVTISEDYDGEDFEVSYPGDFITEIAREGGSTTFYITFMLTQPIDEAKKAEVSIHVNEIDMDVYKFNLVFANCSQTAEIENISDPNAVWNGIVTKFGDVHVLRGATLNVRGEAAFTSDASLIVEQGAKVYVDGGVLTSLCGGLWKGVDVWGNKYLTQYLEENQGYIKLMNGGIISYAEVGLETIKKDDGKPDLTTSGGIVVMNNGNIENCKTGVRFYPYTNFWPDPQHPSLNFSGFTEAHFINDKNCAPDKQLFLKEVDGIDIIGCTFEHKAPNQFNTTYGIYSDMSGFTVSYKNLTPVYPPVDILKSSFKNFDYGIYATGTPAIGRPYITQSVFEDNRTGIYMSQIDYPVIIFNEFNVHSRFPVTDYSTPIGVYINDQSDGYTIEENNFYSELRGSELQDIICEGITLNNTGGYANEVYNNTFNDLSVGVVAAGTNRDGAGAGLCIKCNDFSDCINDVYVTDEGGTNYFGIARAQGKVNDPGKSDPTLTAGNTFSKNDEYDDYKKAIDCGEIVYVHHNATEQNDPSHVIPDPRLNILLDVDEQVSYLKETSCPSNYGGGGMDLMATKSTYSSELVAAEAYQDTLTALVDGGDTEDLTFEVSTSTPDETLELRQNLLGKSSYLSDTVMKSAIVKEEVLPNAMVREVLVANPQSAKSADVLQQLGKRDEPMPGYMMDQIMQGQNIVGAKELLEQNLAGHKTIKDRALKKLMNYYLTDTTDFEASNDTILSLLATDNELSSRYQLIMKYLGMKDSTSAYNTYYSIPTEFDLDDRQETKYELFEDLLGLQWQIMNDTLQPDSLTIEALFDIEQHTHTMPGIYARNILIGLGELDYEEPIFVPDFNKSTTSKLPSWPEDDKVKENLMKLFPNPAGAYFTVEYDLAGYKGKCNLEVFNINGVGIKSIELQHKHDQVVIVTGNYSQGIYVVQLIVNGEIIEAQKLVLIK